MCWYLCSYLDLWQYDLLSWLYFIKSIIEVKQVLSIYQILNGECYKEKYYNFIICSKNYNILVVLWKKLVLLTHNFPLLLLDYCYSHQPWQVYSQFQTGLALCKGAPCRERWCLYKLNLYLNFRPQFPILHINGHCRVLFPQVALGYRWLILLPIPKDGPYVPIFNWTWIQRRNNSAKSTPINALSLADNK